MSTGDLCPKCGGRMKQGKTIGYFWIAKTRLGLLQTFPNYALICQKCGYIELYSREK